MTDQPKDAALAATDTPSPAPATSGSLKGSPIEWSQLTTTWLTRSAAIATAMGAVIVTVYFLRIRYLPIDSLASMASLSGIVALLACALLLSFMVMWGAPSGFVYMTKSVGMWEALSIRLQVPSTGADKPVRISPLRVFGLVTAAVGIPWLAIVLTAVPDLGLGPTYRSQIQFLATATWLAALTCFSYQPTMASFSVQRAGWFAGFSLFATYPLLAFVEMSTMSPLNINGTTTVWLWLLAGLAVAIFLHSVNLGIALKADEGKQAFAWAFQAVAIFICVSGTAVVLGISSKVHDGLMRIVSVRIPHAHIVVQKGTCDALRLAGVNASRYAAMPGETAPDACVLMDVTVLSRVGSQWRIACSRSTETDKTYRGFNIDANEVITLVDVPTEAQVANKGGEDICQGMWSP